VTTQKRDTRSLITAAVRVRLLEDGFAGLSTRAVAAEAGVPLSQLHYHFGSKTGMVLAMMASENERLLERQESMFSEDVSLSKRYEQACDFLEDDLDSGYVRILHEMIAAGWSDAEVAASVREMVDGWANVLVGVAAEAEERFGSLGPFNAEEVAVLVMTAFLGTEALLLLGLGSKEAPMRSALRGIGSIIRTMEYAQAELHPI